MDAAKSVTATLTLAPVAKIGATPYPTLQAPYDAAESGAIIEMIEGNNDAMIANRPISVTVKEGYDAACSGVVGVSSLTGKFLLQAGTVRVQRLKVGPVALTAAATASLYLRSTDSLRRGHHMDF